MFRKLMLIRHEEVAAPHRHAFNGHADVPLSERGHNRATALVPLVRRFDPDEIWSSPSLRALDTARPVLEALTPEFCIRENLKEIDFGDWEGLTFSEIQDRDAHAVSRWAGNDPDFRFPEGESLSEFDLRVKNVATDLLESRTDRIVVFSHGGMIRSLVCRLCAIASESAFAFDIAFGTAVTLTLSGELAQISDICNPEVRPWDA